MKHKYFGDINDYLKYGLLRCIAEAAELPIGVHWMLTPDDTGNDGNFREYLTEPAKWSSFDPGLYEALCRLRDPGVGRSVTHAKAWGLVPNTTYVDELVPDDLSTRAQMMSRSTLLLSACPLVFVDPDNGIEVPTVPAGRRNSSKYIYWTELEGFAAAGHSLLIYQHYPRETREGFEERLAAETLRRLSVARVVTFSTARVLFVLAVQDEHQDQFAKAHELVATRWKRQHTVRIRAGRP